jgi:hypothetical protein
MFTTGIVQIFQATNRTEGMARAQSQLTAAFTRLDREVRYAAAISDVEEDVNNSHVHVRFMTLDPAGTQLCRHARLTRTNLLQYRTWRAADPTPADEDGWSTLASDVGPGWIRDTVDPGWEGRTRKAFEVIAADATHRHQRLALRLRLMDGPPPPNVDIDVDFQLTLTALNTTEETSRTTAAQTVCPRRKDAP